MFLFQKLSYKILGCAFKVYNELGCGLPEKCYQKALIIEFNRLNIKCNEEVINKVYYNNQQVGVFISDLVIDDKIILELKSIDKLNDKNKAQLLTYLKVSKLRVGYLLNFGNTYLERLRLIV